jgi:hypothetical protein
MCIPPYLKAYAKAIYIDLKKNSKNKIKVANRHVNDT